MLLTWDKKGPIGSVDATGSGDSCSILKFDGTGVIDNYGRKLYFASDGSVWRSNEAGIDFYGTEIRILPDKYNSFKFVGYEDDYLEVERITPTETEIQSQSAGENNSSKRLPSVKGMKFEDISDRPALMRSSENFGYVVHYSPDGSRWRTKSEMCRLKIINSGMGELIHDGGYTEYTS